ncbi:MAG: methionyl-tRNA formyltransferase [bacterium]
MKEKIELVVTKPDKPCGRGLKPNPSPVKGKARELGLSVVSPERVVDIKDKLKGFDLGVLVAYGLFIPKSVRELFRYGIINLHPSLLPKYRGAAPIQWALLNGEKETGVSIIYLTEELDAGDVILQKKLEISSQDDAEVLSYKLSILGAEALKNVLRILEENGRIECTPQALLGEPSYAPKITPEMGRIDWNENAINIFNKIRALKIWPKAYFYMNNIRVNILESEPSKEDDTPGKIIKLDNEKGILVATGKGSLWLKMVQPESRKVMRGIDFSNGYRIEIGGVLK